MTQLARLEQNPAWEYLLRDYYELYRRLPAGGSGPIRSHQRTVREAISRIIRSNPPIQETPAQTKPVTAHLQRALDRGREGQLAGFIRSVDAVRNHLDWQYGYERMPRALDRKFAFAELIGPAGPVIADDITLGLVLFAPGCVYPSHAHDGITESYICLSGAMSQNDQGVYVPGSMIFNPPGQLHRITVADREPSLLAYAWVGPKDRLHSQKMAFSRRPKN